MKDYSDRLRRLLEGYGFDRRRILRENSKLEYAWALSPVRENLLEWFPFRPDGSLLQVGADYGALTGLFARRVRRVVVWEPNPSQVALVKARLGAEGLYGMQGDARLSPPRDAKAGLGAESLHGMQGDAQLCPPGDAKAGLGAESLDGMGIGQVKSDNRVIFVDRLLLDDAGDAGDASAAVDAGDVGDAFDAGDLGDGSDGPGRGGQGEEPPDAGFDYVVMIGTLGRRAGEEISAAAGMLKPGGQLILAVCNRLGVKYLMGAGKDETSFVKNELADLLAPHFGEVDYYYPMPDYRMPTTIYSDRSLPGKGEPTISLPLYDVPRYLPADMGEVYADLYTQGRFAEFANSFLVVCGEPIK
ncbi:MAG: hypothetical protein LBR77_03355 [Lachnospiraceae bacterium]|jgi:SAM-dependent methyltransferase|nr:hypothetical protein [Lachnospiraceae bacterium]